MKIYLYSYTVNTFNQDSYPVQLSGEVLAENDFEALELLKKEGIVSPAGWEFLEWSRCEYER